MNNIILIGFMGSGKTTFGKWIARNKNMAFCDTDEYIVKREQTSINDIFAKKGEQYFRNLETEVIKELTGSLTNTVISVGGGLPLKEENRVLLRELGTVVYLRTSQEELVRRLEHDTTRPLLAGGNVKEKIAALMEARQEYYLSAADVIADTGGGDFEKMYQKICAASSDK